MAVVDVGGFDGGVFGRGSVGKNAFEGETLEGCEDVGAGFYGVGWGDDIGVWVRDVGVGVIGERVVLSG